MAGRQRSGVFLSYARNDGEEFAAKLREKLREGAQDIQIKQDRLLLEGGIGYWKQLMEAIDSVEFLILVMTPAAMESEMVRKEWRYARQEGVCVYPVKGAPDSVLQFAKLPRWMSKAHFFDIEKEWEVFVAHLRKGCETPRVPFMAPELPDNFIERPDEFGRLKNHLLSPDRKKPVAITTAVSGAGGFGKTTLAAALCHDEDIIQDFDDGVLWVTLGQQPNAMSGLVTLFAALTGERPGFASEEDAAFQLGQKLEHLSCLVVIDDVWDAAHLRPFLRGGKGCARLFTTRDTEIASEVQRVNVDEMREEESVALLRSGIPGLGETRALELARRLGEYPLALELARATMRQRIVLGDSPEKAAQHLLLALDRKGVSVLKKSTAEPRHQTIDAVVQESLKLLNLEDRKRLTKLSIFPENTEVPLRVAGRLWGLEEFDSEEIAQRLARFSLLKLDLQRGSIRLHDVMRNWLAEGAAVNAPELHTRLVDGWPDWLRLTVEYEWRWLIWHLAQAGRKADIQRILRDPDWLQAKLDSTDVNSLIVDFEYLLPSREADLMQGALRLSAHILARDTGQLWSQLAGRLGPDELRTQMLFPGFAGTGTYLVPYTRTLATPGQALLRTLSGHKGYVDGAAVFANGTRAISASRDNTIRVWDLETGAALLTLTDTDQVMAVALSADGHLAISASRDNTLKVWDLQKGAESRTLRGHKNWVSDLAVYADGTRAISASMDKTIRIWDLETGVELRTLSGHTGEVTAVALYANDTRAISASYDKTLRIWDLDSGAELRALRGHSNLVQAVAVYDDGRRAISGSETLKVWDLKTGTELRTLRGHKYGVSAVAVSADGRRAISGSSDRMLKVWDLESGAELRTWSGHTDKVTAVTLFANDTRAISASWDKSLKVWDLEIGAESRDVGGHAGGVSAIAVYSEGRRAISASADGTLKVWDLETRTDLRTLSGHRDGVRAVAVYANGARAISASMDNTLKVWDLETGAELHTLRGHSREVAAVAVYADDRRAISASWDGTLKVWDLDSGAGLGTLRGHSAMVNALAVSADARRAISASWDNTLGLRDLQTGAALHTLTGHTMWVNALALYEDGRRAISASADRTLKTWDLETGCELYTLRGHTDQVQAVAVYANGRRAISGSHDNTLKVWDLEAGADLGTLSGHTGLVACLAVYPDGGRAVSASHDNTVRLWDLQTARALATFSCDGPVSVCAIAGDAIIVGDALGRVHFLQVIDPAK